VVLDMTRAAPAGPIAILSPHLDDGVLSLGAAIDDWARRGIRVRMVTVLAGDPESNAPAGTWDLTSGFATEGEAARQRREEDRAACTLVGAEPVWLPYGDAQYGRGGDDDRIWAELLEAVGDAPTVLSPGFPLQHPDHAWLGMLALARRDPAWRFGLYVEQPYAIGSGRPRDHDGRLGFDPSFGSVRSGIRARRAKRRAMLTYRSQHEQLAQVVSGTWSDLQQRIASLERDRGGEGIAWVG
jgi:LmbE family N-acetylglucosaminyl deacetylase